MDGWMDGWMDGVFLGDFQPVFRETWNWNSKVNHFFMILGETTSFPCKDLESSSH